MKGNSKQDILGDEFVAERIIIKESSGRMVLYWRLPPLTRQGINFHFLHSSETHGNLFAKRLGWVRRKTRTQSPSPIFYNLTHLAQSESSAHRGICPPRRRLLAPPALGEDLGLLNCGFARIRDTAFEFKSTSGIGQLADPPESA